VAARLEGQLDRAQQSRVGGSLSSLQAGPNSVPARASTAGYSGAPGTPQSQSAVAPTSHHNSTACGYGFRAPLATLAAPE
jgi:hypothetical protein